MDPSAIAKETAGPDLGSVLMDQRMRADKHRMNFDALKSQHIVLQEVGGVRWGWGDGVGWEKREWSGGDGRLDVSGYDECATVPRGVMYCVGVTIHLMYKLNCPCGTCFTVTTAFPP